MSRDAVNNDDIRIRHVRNRFPKDGRQHSSIAEATGSIDDDDFAIPGQAKVLQPVVGHDDIAPLVTRAWAAATIAPDEGDALGAAVQQ